MKTLIEAAQEYAQSRGYDAWDCVTKKDFEEYAKIDFYAGVEYAQRWIPVDEELPKSQTQVLGKSQDGHCYICQHIEKYSILADGNISERDFEMNTELNPLDLKWYVGRGWWAYPIDIEQFNCLSIISHWRPIEIE